MKKTQAAVIGATPRIATLSLLIGAMFASPVVRAGSADISNTPLANTSDISAKPNLMMVLDDSGSMAWSFMPDDLGQNSQGQSATDATALGRYGGLSAQCNGVAYNPNFNYSGNLPLQPDGTSYPHAIFATAMDDGFQMNLTGTTRSSTTSVTMGAGDLVFKLSGAPYTTTVGSTIAIVSTADVTRWMMGTIKSWNSTTSQLTVTVTKYVGSGAYASWTVGNPVTANLNNSTYYRYTGTQPALSWTFSASTLWHVVNTFSNECLSTIGNSPGSSVFTAVTVTSASTEAQNYADWYAYYRKRFLMMRSVSGTAFNGLDTKYRVGFTTISNTGVNTTSATFQDVKDFDATQKATFYSKLYRADPGGSTPLRGALSKVGRYYAKLVSGQTYDPMQYACQRNYTMLSTDGYWNTGSESSTYTSLQLDGTTAVGQQDGGEVKPMWDGQKTKVTTTTPYSTVIHQQATYNRTYSYTVTGATYKTWNASGCSGSKKKLVTYSGAKGTETDTGAVTDLEDVAGTTTQTVVTLDGVPQSTTYSTPNSSGSPSVTSSSAGTGSFSSFTLSSYTSVTTASSCTTASGDSVSGGTKVLASTSDGSKTRTVLSQSPVTATGSSTVTATSFSGGEGDTLADIAEYYYATDLRTTKLGNCSGALNTDVCFDEVPPGDRDKASWQHMTTFTMGLGVGGILTYDRNYLTQTSGDYFNLKQGTVSWPIPSVSGNGDPTNVDDLWHAAVNGRGQYFATTDPTSLADAINTVLTSVTKATGSSAAASTTSLMPVAGDNNLVFVATYTTLEWSGDLQAYALDAATGAIALTPTWSVQGKVDGVNASTRTIYYLQPGGLTTTPRAFTKDNLVADGYGSYFTSICTKATIPAQCATLTATQKTRANDAANLVNYLRGDRTNESYNDTSVTPAQSVELYRARAHVLGDIINAAPVFVGKPPMPYSDSGYADFVAAKATRKPMVYAAANDGMLHAFSADVSDGGNEMWAYVPSFVMPNLYQLADTNYKNNHRYFVDGSPVVGDIYVGGAWKTILVGGLNSGGKGYYCLDITNPTSPKTLWEFTDANMGYTYGNPIITKRANGTWVVAFTSGYNNTSGDGNGHLYVVNANTGVSVLTKDIATYTAGAIPAGNSASPSGLGKLDVWLDDAKNNTAARFYSGDLQGNLWRFDIDGVVEPKNAALLLANFSVGGTPQSITARATPAMVSTSTGTYPLVVVGTGRYLGLSDISDKTTQSLYAIKDPLTDSGWGSVRGRTDMVVQTLTDTTVASGANKGAKIRTITNKAVDWSTKMGWQVDMPSSGERVVVDFTQQFSLLTLVSTIPGIDECRPSGGTSWLYNLNLSNGSAPSSAVDGAAGSYLGNSIAVGVTVIETADGKTHAIVQMNGGDKKTIDLPCTSNCGGGSGPARRTSWRELTN